MEKENDLGCKVKNYNIILKELVGLFEVSNVYDE